MIDDLAVFGEGPSETGLLERGRTACPCGSRWKNRRRDSDAVSAPRFRRTEAPG